MTVIDQMKLLISLAQIDGNVAEQERTYITNIGKANGLSLGDIASLLEKRHALTLTSDLPHPDKFNILFNLVQLMKIDERMYKEEMLFCSKIAVNLGYDQQVMFDLLMHIKPTDMPTQDKENLRNITEKYHKVV
jgi:hypothetical protein